MVANSKAIKTLVTEDEHERILSKTTIHFHYNRKIREEILENFHPTYSKASLKKYYDAQWDIVNEEYYEDDVLEFSSKDSPPESTIRPETGPSARNELSPPGEVFVQSRMDSPIDVHGKREVMKDLVSATGERYDLVLDLSAHGDFISQRSISQYTQTTISHTIYDNEYNDYGHLIKQTVVQLPQGPRFVIKKTYEYY
jgi:hypothetical protein